MKGWPIEGLPMDVNKLLAMTPEEVAKAIIARRHDLSDVLPEVVRSRKEELNHLKPMVDEALSERDKVTSQVATLKEKRNSSQAEAKKLRVKLTALRETLVSEKRLKNPNPAWAKEKLATQLEELEQKLETSALDLNAERKLLRQMKELSRSHDEWVNERIESDPGMKEYQDGWKMFHQLLEDADAAHEELTKLAPASEDHHQKYSDHRDIQKDAQRQHDRAKSLLDSTDEIIKYWNHRIDNGFDDLKDGSGDLMAASRMVAEGKPSSMPRVEKPEKEEGEEE